MGFETTTSPEDPKDILLRKAEQSLAYEDRPKLPLDDRREVLGPKTVISEVSPTLELAYIVPISKELSNGNLFAQLRDLMNQKGIRYDQFEVVYVVNNAQDAKNSWRYEENQLTLDIFAYIAQQTDTLPEGLTKRQLQIVQDARKRGLRIQALDMSTKGIVPVSIMDSKISGLINESRAAGYNFAAARFMQTDIRDQGALICFDTDARIGADTTLEIKKQLVDNPSRQALEVQYDLLAGQGSESHFYDLPANRINHNISRLTEMLSGLHYGWKTYKVGQWQISDPRKRHPSLWVEGIALAQGETLGQAQDVRLYVHDREQRQGGRFSRERYEETASSAPDAAAKQAERYVTHPVKGLLSTKRSLYLGDISMFLHVMKSSTPEERQRVQEVCCQIAEELLPAAEALKVKEKIYDIKSMHYAIEIDSFKHGVLAQNAVDMWKRIFEILLHDAPEEKKILDELIRKEHHIERIRKGAIRRSVIDMVTKAYEQAEPLTLQTYLDGRAADTHPSTQHYLEYNSWIFDIVNSLRQEHGSAPEAITALEKKFPSFILPYKQDDVSRANTTIRGITRFCQRVMNEPNEFSHASVLIRAQEHYPYIKDRARRAVAAQEYPVALALYEDAIAIEPNDDKLMREYITQEIKHGDVQKALMYSKQQRDTEPAAPTLQLNYLEALYRAKSSDEVFEAALELFCESIFSAQKMYLFLSGSIADRLAYRRKVAVQNSDNALVTFYTNLKSRITKALLRLLKRKKTDNPQDKKIYEYESKVLFMDGQFEAADDVCAIAIDTLQSNADKQFVVTELSEEYAKTKNIDKAIYWWTRIIDIDPFSEDAQTARRRLGKAYANKGDIDEAIAVYEQGARAEGNPGYFLLNIAELHLQDKNYAQAQKFYKRVVSELEDVKIRLKGIRGLAMVAYDQGHYEKALAHYQQMLDLIPSADLDIQEHNTMEVKAHERKGDIYVEQKLMRQARHAYETAVEMWHEKNELLPGQKLPSLIKKINDKIRKLSTQ